MYHEREKEIFNLEFLVIRTFCLESIKAVALAFLQNGKFVVNFF